MGIDDYIFAIILLLGLLIIRKWLIKIYRRVRDIDRFVAHYMMELKKSNE